MCRIRLLINNIFVLLLAGLAAAVHGGIAQAGSLAGVASMVQAPAPAPGLFLVASRDLADPHFSRTVIYLVTHNDAGSLGLVVNLFTAVIVTRTFLHFILMPFQEQALSGRRWLLGLQGGSDRV